MASNNKKMTSIIIVDGKSADPSSPHQRTRGGIDCTHVSVTLAKAGQT